MADDANARNLLKMLLQEWNERVRDKKKVTVEREIDIWDRQTETESIRSSAKMTVTPAQKMQKHASVSTTFQVIFQ